jgi:hypothetical protein
LFLRTDGLVDLLDEFGKTIQSGRANACFARYGLFGDANANASMQRM